MIGRRRPPEVKRKSEVEIQLMREAGRIVAATLGKLKMLIAPGVTTGQLDQAARECLDQAGAVSSFLGYRDYPAVICVEINDIVVHGIPSEDVVLHGGDIVGVDLGASYRNYHADAAFTMSVGETDEASRRLMAATEEALHRGIEAAQVGRKLGEVCGTIQRCVEGYGYSVVRDLVGHGIGRSMHEPPQIPNYLAPGQFPEYDIILRPGMTLAIEPMVNMGGYELRTDADGWTVRTADGLPSAHFEHTIAITKDGPRILTVT